MTIDNAIGLLERGSQYNFYDSAEDFCKAYDMAIEVMRKYQKIEQILNDWKEIGYSEDDGLYSLISEVVEDGNKIRN